MWLQEPGHSIFASVQDDVCVSFFFSLVKKIRLGRIRTKNLARIGVSLFMFQSICLCSCVPVCRCIYLCVFLSVCMSILFSVSPSLCLFVSPCSFRIVSVESVSVESVSVESVLCL